MALFDVLVTQPEAEVSQRGQLLLPAAGPVNIGHMPVLQLTHALSLFNEVGVSGAARLAELFGLPSVRGGISVYSGGPSGTSARHQLARTAVLPVNEAIQGALAAEFLRVLVDKKLDS
ncbi:hypothetical protein OG863_38940 [Streptomyces decoyicus]|uniref:Uncharacterized protein n=1 Tax=Streptomyces decoyicus TaxID=249567 RepID=A0ABZ1FSN7_9ACTN|nr:hypothetical protein [Streptomyces decoyicus]WSB73447.1 hypothetical protein OG863_38940 [Streptomyces decoyicus]